MTWRATFGRPWMTAPAGELAKALHRNVFMGQGDEAHSRQLERYVRRELGRVVQADPMKPVLKAPKTKCLKLKQMDWFQVLLSNSTCAATAGVPQHDGLARDRGRPV